MAVHLVGCVFGLGRRFYGERILCVPVDVKRREKHGTKSIGC